MSRRTELPTSPHHIKIYDEDWEFILDHFGPGSPSEIGASAAIRQMVHGYVRRLKAKAEQAASEAQASSGGPSRRQIASDEEDRL